MGELIALGIVTALLPLVLLWHWGRGWFRYIKYLPPREQALARASHGAAMIALAALCLYVSGTPLTLGAAARLWATNPAAIAAWCAVVAWGVGWLVIGASRSRGPRDALLASRAVVKTAVGIGTGYLLMTGAREGNWLGELSDPETAAIFFVLAAFPVWCTATGLVKLGLVMRGAGGRRPRASEVEEQKSRGSAGDASPNEAAAALQGRGGRRLALDELEF